MHGRVLVAFVLIGTGYAAYTDLKTSEVADEVSMVVAGGGLLFHLWDSLGTTLITDAALVVATLLVFTGWAAVLRRGPFAAREATWWHVGGGGAALIGAASIYAWAGPGLPVTAAFAAGTGLFLFGWLLYLTGAWGGADAFVLAAIGYAVPMLPHGLNPPFAAPWPFLLSLVTTTLLIGALYSTLYAFYRTVQEPGMVRTFLSQLRTDRRRMGVGSGVYGVAAVGIVLLGQAWYGLPVQMMLPVMVGGYAVFAGIFLLTQFLRFVEDSVMRRTIPVDDLRPGDVLAEDVPLETEEQLAVGPVEAVIGRLGAALNRVLPFTTLERTETKIVGLTPAQVEEVRAKRDTVTVKTGVQFVPVFPAALVILVLVGDPLWMLSLGIG